MPETLTNEVACVPRPGKHTPSRVLLGCVLVLLLAAGGAGYHVFLGSNFHTVVPGRVYRCAQLSAAELEQTVRQHGIRTVVNLRGFCAPQGWYVDEGRAAHRLNVSLVDIGLSAGRFPSSRELRHFIDVLNHAEFPILLHCKQGADRTGLVSTIVLLLTTDMSLEEARRQLAPRFGHVPLGRTANLDAYLDLYADWLREQGRSHDADAFRAWLDDPSCPGPYRCRLEALDFPRRIPRQQPIALHVRAWNTSRKPWRFQPDNHTGIHLCYALRDLQEQCVHVGRAGMFDATVPAGDYIDLTITVPTLAPGRYRLLVDMLDEPHCIFYQTGNEPLECELTVE